MARQFVVDGVRVEWDNDELVLDVFNESGSAVQIQVIDSEDEVHCTAELADGEGLSEELIWVRSGYQFEVSVQKMVYIDDRDEATREALRGVTSQGHVWGPLDVIAIEPCFLEKNLEARVTGKTGEDEVTDDIVLGQPTWQHHAPADPDQG